MEETLKIKKLIDKETIILFWVSIVCQIILIVWIILKFAGVIHSPIWQEMIPYAVIAIPVISGVVSYRKTLQKAETNIEMIHLRLNRMEPRFDKIDTKFDRIEQKLEKIAQELKEFRHDFNVHLVKYHA
ncbi:hypothetical protein HYS47_00515 [Candidatus Woesearchaeota archaeon]|nr:hypothetical protein [Candidatus Woesearchaeota archaeon]